MSERHALEMECHENPMHAAGRIIELEADNAKLREAIHDIERVIARLFALEADE